MRAWVIVALVSDDTQVKKVASYFGEKALHLQLPSIVTKLPFAPASCNRRFETVAICQGQGRALLAKMSTRLQIVLPPIDSRAERDAADL